MDVPPPCHCASLSSDPTRLRVVNDLLALNLSANRIERVMKAKGMPIKAETVSRHLRECLGGKRPAEASAKTVVPPESTKRPALTKTNMAVPPENATHEERDLARLVQAKAAEGIINGTLRVSVKDGLSATSILDKREARLEDRRFMIGLARLLSGAGTAGPQGDDPNVIDVTPRNPLLAPQSLRADE